MTNLIKNWNDRAIRIRSDRYVSLTDMAQANGKQFSGWNRLESTKSYLTTLSSVMQICTTDLVQVIQGGDPQNQGTWGHPKVAIRFAQWCSDEFAVQVDIWTDELMTTGKVELTTQQPAIAPSLPQDYEQALVALLDTVREKKALTVANQQLEQEKQELTTAIAIVKPKAEFYDIYVSRDGWLTGEQIAKQLSVSTRKMFDVLRGEKVIYCRSGRNFPCADWVNKGWATMRPVRCHDEIMRNNLVFSHKVIMQIFDLLQDKGLIDKDRQYNIHFQTDEPRHLKMA